MFSQNQRFVFEYSFKMDSLNQENVGKEIMNLDVTKDGSTFYSALLLARDSLFRVQFERGKASKSMEIDMRTLKKPKVNFSISKSFPDLQSVYHTSLSGTYLAVKELETLEWRILPESKTIENFKVQKATTTFGGRNWIAWFTDEIQIQDGPYKFCGLPGLILHVEDEKGDHRFQLVGIQNLEGKPTLMQVNRNEIFVTKEKFNQYWKEYKNDPAKNIKLLHSSSEMSDTLFYNANDGSRLTKQDLIRNKEKGLKENLKKYNNYLEKNLYK